MKYYIIILFKYVYVTVTYLIQIHTRAHRRIKECVRKGKYEKLLPNGRYGV